MSFNMKCKIIDVKLIAKFITFCYNCNVHISYANVCLRDLNRAAIPTANDESLQ